MSANASKGKIISLEEARKSRLLVGSKPPPFDPAAIQQRLNRIRTAPSHEEREIALGLVIRDAEELLRLVQVMGSEIVHFRQQIQSFATQVSDTSVVNALLLHLANGQVRVPAKWFEAWDPPPGAGFEVVEDGEDIVIRAIDATTPVADPVDEVVDSLSASQQTEDV